MPVLRQLDQHLWACNLCQARTRFHSHALAELHAILDHADEWYEEQKK